MLFPSSSRTADCGTEIALLFTSVMISTLANISGFSRPSLFATSVRTLTVRESGSTTLLMKMTVPEEFEPGKAVTSKRNDYELRGGDLRVKKKRRAAKENCTPRLSSQ